MHTKSNVNRLVDAQGVLFQKDLSRNLFANPLADVILKSVPDRADESFSFESESIAEMMRGNIRETLKALSAGEIGTESNVLDYLEGDLIGCEGVNFATSLASICGEAARGETQVRKQMVLQSLESNPVDMESDNPAQAIFERFGELALENERILDEYTGEIENIMDLECENIVKAVKDSVAKSIEDTSRKNEIIQAAVEELADVKNELASKEEVDETPAEDESQESFDDIETIEDKIKAVVPGTILSLESVMSNFSERDNTSKVVLIVGAGPKYDQEFIAGRLSRLEKVVALESDEDFKKSFDIYSKKVLEITKTATVIEKEIFDNLGINFDRIVKQDGITANLANAIVNSMKQCKDGYVKLLKNSLEKGVQTIDSVEVALESMANLAFVNASLAKIEPSSIETDMISQTGDYLRISYENLNDYISVSGNNELKDKAWAMEIIGLKCNPMELFDQSSLESEYIKTIAKLQPKDMTTPAKVMDRVQKRINDQIGEITDKENELVVKLIEGKGTNTFDDSLYERFVVAVSRKNISLEGELPSEEESTQLERRSRLYTTHATALEHFGIFRKEDINSLINHLV